MSENNEIIESGELVTKVANLEDQDNTNNTTEEDPPSKIIHFNVKYKDEVEKIWVPLEETVSTLIKLISDEFYVLPSYQLLSGCGLHANSIEEVGKVPIGDLKLSPVNYIQVEDGRESKMGIDILQEATGQRITLQLSYDTTIQEMKHHVFCITSIPVRHQEWSGWPRPVKDDNSTVGQAGLSCKTRPLRLRSLEATPSPNTSSSMSSTDELASESDDSSSDLSIFEGLDVSDAVYAQPKTTLISMSNKDMIEGTTQFKENYKKRFGDQIPDFFIGDLNSAFEEVSNQTGDNKKMLAIYLHHSDSILTNIFCHHVMKNETLLATLRKLFIVYGWDLTKRSNSSYFLRKIKEVISLNAGCIAEGIEVDKLPAFLLVARNASGDRVVKVIHGDVGTDELHLRLLTLFDSLVGINV